MKAGAHKSHRSSKSASYSVEWIRGLALPYLNGYEAVAANEEGLEGYWFFANAAQITQLKPSKPSSKRSPSRKGRLGFFVGYLTDGVAQYSFLKIDPPECVIFAWVNPAGGPLHEKLVRQQGSLVRKIFEYIRWLTHRPPRFVFHEAEAAAMARHASMKDWPLEKREHFSRNFFIETLAWLVRSGLVRKLHEEATGFRSKNTASLHE